MGNTFPGFENVVTSLDAVHARIHQGLFFSADMFDPALANLANLDVLIRPDASVSMHIRFIATAGGDAQVWLYENTTFSAPGVAQTSQNRNRVSQRTALGLVNLGPTVTAVGDELLTGLLPGGKAGQASGSEKQSFEEWILAPGLVYLARLQNIAGQVQPVNMQVDYYEPVGKLR